MAKKQKAQETAVAPQQTVAKLVLGSRAPKHRAGHNATAWTAVTAKLPATATELAELPEVKVCGGPKSNGLLFVSYAIRRGWLAPEAVAETQQS